MLSADFYKMKNKSCTYLTAVELIDIYLRLQILVP